MAHQDLQSTGSLFQGHAYVHGQAHGTLIASNIELSFWGGVDAQTGEVIDRHHPLSGKHVHDGILAIPGGRGSCTGSGVLLELLLNNKGPRALLFQRREDILTLGVMIAEEMFSKNIPVITLEPSVFCEILKLDGQAVYVSGSHISTEESKTASRGCRSPDTGMDQLNSTEVTLSDFDRALVDGAHGQAARVAMRIVLRMADLLGAEELMDVTQVHVDGCIYTGPGSLAFAERLRDWGGKVCVPTSLNSISIDQKRWRAHGVDPLFAEEAGKLANAYTDMGAKPTFTCAPYQLDSAPKRGEQVAWAESNAVVYANSVLGARTMKYPDFLDIAIALTGRAPKGGPHVDINRLASLVVKVIGVQKETMDDSLYPLLGYHVGTLAPSEIPVIVGLEHLAPSKDDLQAFGAAFATVSSAPMFHIAGITPEAKSVDDAVTKESSVRTVEVEVKDLGRCWDELNGTALGDQTVDLVSLGNPHFSFSEIRRLADLCRGREKDGNVAVMVTCGRAIYSLAQQAGIVEELEKFGVQFLTDTCWCMIAVPTIPHSTRTIMTNSGKFAHYGPGLTGLKFCFGSLAACVETACRGIYSQERPEWLASVLA